MRPIKQEQKIVVGFKVVNNDFLKQLKEQIKIEEDPIELLKLIVEEYYSVLNLYLKLFLDKKDEKIYFKKFPKGTKIHYEFVRKFLNISKRKPARTAFIDLKILKGFSLKKFSEWFIENNRWIKDLRDCLEQYEEQKNLNLKEIALIIKKINSDNGINFVEKLTSQEGIDFIGREMSEFLLIKQEINIKAKKIKENLLKIENIFLAKTDVGLNIFNGSLNYFSVNKKLDDYKKEEEKLKQKMNEAIGNRYDVNFNGGFNLFNIFSDYFKRYGYNSLEEVRLKDFRQILKDIKGKEKAKFLEEVCDLEFRDLEEKHPLFVFLDKESFEKFKRFSQQIRNGRGNKDIAKKRGGFLHYQSKYCRTKRYAALNKLYEKVAKDYGRINAKLKAIENIIDNIRKLQYWLIFVQIEGVIKLVAIPKSENLENLKGAYQFLKKNNNKNEEVKVLVLNSFTLKALNKLLFREDSSFRRDLSREIDRGYLEEIKLKYLQARNNQVELDEYSQEQLEINLQARNNRAELNDEELVKFYQQVLKTEYAQKNLKFDFNKIKDILNKDYDSVENFRLDLEKRLYEFEEIYLSMEKYQEFLKRCQAIEFTIVPIDTKKNPQNRWHKNLWFYFWSNKNQTNYFPVRINPEIKFFYKEKDEEKIQYLIDKFGKEKVFSPNFKHRFLEDRIIAKINFEINIPSERINFSFKKRFEIEEEIEKFNQKFNNQNKNYQSAYYFGLDRGTDEFVSLGIYRTDGKDYHPEKITAYKIRDEFLGQVVTAQQKWFDDFSKYFEEVESDYLDLTTAKLVDGKIIINSEWKTLLELTKLHYKNKIFSVVDELAVDDVFIDDKGQFFLKTTKKHNNGVVPIGYYRNNFSKFAGGKIDEIITELKEYIRVIKKYKSDSRYEMRFEKIINYKNALAANVVGILEFLRKKYDNVYFLLENLNISDIARQSQQQAQAVHRQLEWLLLNKLRKKDLVPSDISKQIIFREQKGDRQLGVVLFLKEERTSTLCPCCETERMGYSKEEFKNAKFQQRQIRCKKCGSSFHPDEIACINLAKKGFSFLDERLV